MRAGLRVPLNRPIRPLRPLRALVLVAATACTAIEPGELDERLDADRDGYDAEQFGGDDCDDGDEAIHPGADDPPYDGVDSACDGDLREWDVDGDGSVLEDDCDDADPSVHPGGADTWYDGVDSDCDGADDCDRDRDGFPAVGVGACLEEVLLPPYDCDDGNTAVHPLAYDAWYDGVDSNCDGANDCDQDGDGYAAEGPPCHGDDCQDTNPERYPGATGRSLLGGVLDFNDCDLL